MPTAPNSSNPQANVSYFLGPSGYLSSISKSVRKEQKINRTTRKTYQKRQSLVTFPCNFLIPGANSSNSTNPGAKCPQFLEHSNEKCREKCQGPHDPRDFIRYAWISILMLIKNLPENLHQRPHFEQFWVAAGQEHAFDQIQLSGSSSSISPPLMHILQKPRTLLPSAFNSLNPPANSSQFFEPFSEFLPILRTLQRISPNSSNP